MSVWLIASIVLLAGAVTPALLAGLRGRPVDRLVGLQQCSAVAAVLLLVFAQASGRPSYLIVPLVLVLLSFTGTLVFTRLLVTRR